MAELLLQPRMGVIPIGPVVGQRETIGEGLSRLDARERNTRHAVHVKRHQEPVPVDRRIFVQCVGHIDRDVVAFAKPHERRGQRTVGAHGLADTTVDTHRELADRQVKARACESWKSEIAGARRFGPGGQEPGAA